MTAQPEAGAPAPLVADAAAAPLAGAANAPASVTTAAAETFSVADAIEVAQTCALAGRTDLVAGFLQAKVAPAKVRSQLLAAQADASPEIVSRIDPNAASKASLSAANPASPDNPLIQAVKSRLGTSKT